MGPEIESKPQIDLLALKGFKYFRLWKFCLILLPLKTPLLSFFTTSGSKDWQKSTTTIWTRLWWKINSVYTLSNFGTFTTRYTTLFIRKKKQKKSAVNNSKLIAKDQLTANILNLFYYKPCIQLYNTHLILTFSHSIHFFPEIAFVSASLYISFTSLCAQICL